MKRAALLCCLVGCQLDGQSPIARCVLAPNAQPFVTSLAPDLMEQLRREPRAPLPEGFHFGTATAAFQIESNITQSDWSVWTHMDGRVANGDTPANGPHHEEHVAADVARMQSLGTNAYRFGVEWSLLFPTKEALLAEPPQPDAAAVAHYNALLDALVAAGIRPMLTLQHFTLPLWLSEGLLSADFVPLAARFAGWAAGAFGDRIDYWITLNEPSGIAGGGYIDGSFPPGHLVDLTGFISAYAQMIEAHARMYDAIAGIDRDDADGDGVPALISFASHNRLWLPRNETSDDDLKATRRLRYISNLLLIEAASCGNYDANFDEKLSDEVDRVADPSLRDRLDFIALNYYGTAAAVAFPVDPFLGLPQIEFPDSARPKTDLGWDMAPEGLLPVLAELQSYRLPIILTENGVADSADVLRKKFLVDSFIAIQAGRSAGYDIRGYYHWSLIDNFEWALGLCPRLGLFAVDYASPDKTRSERPSAGIYRDIIANRGVPSTLVDAFSYGSPTACPK